MINTSAHEYSVGKQEYISRNLLENLIYNSPIKNEEQSLRILDFHRILFSHLRSKIYPENSIEKFTTDLFYTLLYQNKSDIHCILAGPTALKELSYFINFIHVFESELKYITPHFILVEWPNLRHSLKEQHRDFVATVNDVLNYLNLHLGHFNLNVFSLFLSARQPVPCVDRFFKREFKSIIHSIQTKDNVRYHQKTDLDIDADWITNFYSRQASLCNFDPRQAIFDLAVRRTIGAYMSDVLKQSMICQKTNLLVTSELHKRFLKCYRTEATICNINIADNL